jgi:predicted dehydrogenase
MRRIRIGIIGAGAATEWSILPVLSGPDIMAPPDTGAWWGRRAPSTSDIYYQAPARPEVVALADEDGARAQRVANLARVRGVYSDWRAMLREVELDAVLCTASPHVAAEVAVAAGAAVKWLWLAGPPAGSAAAALQLARDLQGRTLCVWCSRALRRAVAHRGAWRLIERGHIGAVAALALRWGAPLHNEERRESSQALPSTQDATDAPHLASSYAALDLLLHFAAGSHRRERDNDEVLVDESASANGARVVADEFGGATNVWLRLADGVTATALFSGAESWSAPLPRLEVCGTQGRWLVCEAGRRMWLHQPRETAHLLEPPGMIAHVTAANVMGVAEDLKAFLAACAGESDVSSMRHQPGQSESREPSLWSAVGPLALLEAINAALHSGEPAHVQVLEPVPSLSVGLASADGAPRPTATLPSTLPLPL